jgi:adenylylsulfate kinase
VLLSYVSRGASSKSRAHLETLKFGISMQQSPVHLETRRTLAPKRKSFRCETRVDNVAAAAKMSDDCADPTGGSKGCQVFLPKIQHRGATAWLTGLSGSGKTTICVSVYQKLLARGFRVEFLDGDLLRSGLNSDLGFSKQDRDENVRRIGFVAQLLTRNGIIVLVAAISPYREARDGVRQAIGDFFEVHVDAPLHLCEQRDKKGLYRRARVGEIKGFTGIDDPYEAPISPEIVCHTAIETIEESAEKVLSRIAAYALGCSKFVRD